MSSTKTVMEWETSRYPHLSSPADKVAANADLLTEILLRLPIKSLIRFKLVSKCWLSLITNPFFSSRRIPNLTPSGLFLYRNLLFPCHEYEFLPLNADTSTPPFGTLNFAPDPLGIRILHSCNGLLCCCSLQGNEKYYIYNPTTKQFATLPKPKLSHDVIGMNLAFDPAKSPHYKVVCVRSSAVRPEHLQIEIYSSETGLWRVSGEPFLSGIDTDYDWGVYYNGAIHWISEWGDSLYFDIDQELLRTMPMPPIPEYWDHRIFSYFGESRDHLHLIQTYEPPISRFNVYEMERDHSGWFVKYKVDLGSVAEAFPEMTDSNHDPMDWIYYNYILLSVVRGETEEDSFLVLHIKGKTIRYNFLDKTFKALCDYDPADTKGVDNVGLRFGGWFCAFPFIESLCCV